MCPSVPLSSDVERQHEHCLYWRDTISTTHKVVGFLKHKGLAIIKKTFLLWSDSCPSQ